MKSKRTNTNIIRHKFYSENKKTNNKLKKEISPDTSILDCIQKRITSFKSFTMDQSVTNLSKDSLIQYASIKSDLNHGKFDSMIEVKDTGPLLKTSEELEEARSYFNNQIHVPVIWRTYLEKGEYAPFLFKRTGFINLFSDNAIVMVDMFRPPWKPYFTSDVFLYQWLKATSGNNDLNDLPVDFPPVVYIHNISNHISKYKIKDILDENKADLQIIDCKNDPQWEKLKTIPHLKCFFYILQSFNELNFLRKLRQYTISSLQMYRKHEIYHLKLNLVGF